MKEPQWREVEETEEERIVNDKIDAWHLGAGEGLTLAEYLGWTEEEFDHWIATNELPHGK